MAEKDANDSHFSLKNFNKSSTAGNLTEEDDPCDKLLDGENKKDESESLDVDSCPPIYESPLKKEENPFSFKKFLNQDSSAQKSKGARKKIYAPANVTTSSKLDLSSHHLRSQPDTNSRMVNTTDVSSVLPDFVQDHLVIEQCYLSGSSAIDIDNLNLQNLPDLNLEHRNIHFNLQTDTNAVPSSQNATNQLSSNLPDFTLGARHFQSGTQNKCNSKGLPDFTLNVGTKVSGSLDANGDSNVNFMDNSSRRKVHANDGSETSQSVRQRNQISSSPSVPLDLPSYESNDSSQNLCIPFDLTIPAEEKNGTSRGMNSETVSKSLPDFLSDGPIKKEINENMHNVRENASSMQNGLPPPEISSIWSDHERLLREVELLRRQLTDKSRRLELLESELEHLHSTDQRETVTLEFALHEVENNLKQTAKRALNAEDMVLKLKQENKLLKAEISTLQSENVQLRLGNYESRVPPSQEIKNHKIAKELRTAANMAENSLRTLLTGIENLRVIAASMENIQKFDSNSEEYQSFLHEDSASGPAL